MENSITHTPATAFDLAQKNGCIELSSGVWLNTQESIIEEQKGWFDEDGAKGFDFTKAPMWISTDDGVLVPIYGADDENLINALSNH